MHHASSNVMHAVCRDTSDSDFKMVSYTACDDEFISATELETESHTTSCCIDVMYMYTVYAH